MTEEAEASFPSTAKPYDWDETRMVPQETLKLWREVGNGIEQSQTVVWKSSVDSLDQANKYIRTSKDARAFVEKYMYQIISILVEQQPTKIGPHERNCVQESLAQAVTLIACDIELQMERNGESVLLNVLSLIFNKKKAYYKGNKGNFHTSHMSGLPEVRLKMIDRFREERGFARLRQYMVDRIGTPIFPVLEPLHQILTACADNLPNHNTPNGPVDIGPAGKDMEDAAIGVAKAVMQYVSNSSEDDLKKLPPDYLNHIQRDLQRVFDRLIPARRESTYEFYEYWRGLVLKLITSRSLPLKLFGWSQMDELLDACADHRPPPREFEATEAGCTFVNGKYVFAGTVTSEGYAQQGADVSYERVIPPEVEDGGGKKLTLFRCTMRSQQKWWFLSEADEEQPGTDRDIDYYQHKSKEHEETEPPPQGWVTCRNSGIDPPPRLRSIGLMVPPGEEFNTLEHLLARWAIENGIIELVLGDSAHREVVARSTALIKFLASMCERDQVVGPDVGNVFCLQKTHLLLAWNTCTRNTDAAISAQVYQLLVSILPSCPGSLANPLLQAMQESLVPNKEKRHYLTEVAEFCSMLASANFSDPKSTSGINIADDVRAGVLQLLWAVLTHPDASKLKNYDSLKRYVTNELRVEPMGTKHRENYLRACVNALSANARKQGDEAIDEAQALGMVKLVLFVLEACPREQAPMLVMSDQGELPQLLFKELTSFLKRRHSANDARNPVGRKPSSPEYEVLVSLSLSERLRILRFVYGISKEIFMTSDQLHNLWQLCAVEARDQEELMIFIASAAGNGSPRGPVTSEQATYVGQQIVGPANDGLSAAFTGEVSNFAFLDLFCSPSVSFDSLGEGAYRSFQSLFSKLRISPGIGQDPTAAALDTLWRISLRANNAMVAHQAMKDLMSLYIASNADGSWSSTSSSGNDRMDTDAAEESFGKRVFECLLEVKKGLKVGLGLGDVSAELAAERCLRILNAAIGQSGSGSSPITSSTLARVAALPSPSNLHEVLKFIPHGMRGQACYRKIGIMTKRTNIHTQQGPLAQPSPIARDDMGSRAPTTVRFSLNVHPLETLISVKSKVATHCQCSVNMVRPVSVNGRVVSNDGRNAGPDMSQMNLNVVPEDAVMDELGIVQGCEIIFVIAEQRQPVQQQQPNPNPKMRSPRGRDLSNIFFNDTDQFSDKLFQTIFDVLELILSRDAVAMSDSAVSSSSVTQKLIWDLLMAMPTNSKIASLVKASANDATGASVSDDDAMETDSKQESWSRLLDLQNFQRSVYNLIAIDAFLQPSPEVMASLPQERRLILDSEMINEAVAFRRGFIDSGGFDAVVRFFSASNNNRVHNRMGNAVALRILKCCLFGDANALQVGQNIEEENALDEVGTRLLDSLSDAEGLLRSLAKMVVDDSGISTSAISDVLKFLRLLFQLQRTAESFIALPDALAEKFLISLLLWEGKAVNARFNAAIEADTRVRRDIHDLILKTPALADHSLPWLIKAIDSVKVVSESTQEYFDVLQKLIGDVGSTARSKSASPAELSALATAVCRKLSLCPRPTTETAMSDVPTGVLCGCLILLRALIESGGGALLKEGTGILIKDQNVSRWSEKIKPQSKGTFSIAKFRGMPHAHDIILVDLMGVIFDGYLSPGGSSSVVAICCDKPSRQFGFNVVDAAARACSGSGGYIALVSRINSLISSASPHLRHRWNQSGGPDGQSRSGRHSVYSGLRNQGCTCYMNSLLQQLFMMTELRKSICAAPLPVAVRSSGGAASSKGAELVGKRLSMQWDNGVAYDAIVEGYDEDSGMHTIRYCPVQVATVAEANHQQVQPDDITKLPPLLPDEFFLSEGRPGKETGAFEIVNANPSDKADKAPKGGQKNIGVKETEDEASSRHLLEEVQRTFIHLDEGSRGRCFDPRALVEACACLKLEFDVWQQNDASEFATKLLDRLEMPLKRWAPDHFRYLDHTFGLKQTKQKICKECGLKTNREEKLLNIDCQIRGKVDIHEALGTMTEVEVMEGSNQVFCDRCKKNTDTVLRTAISSLPNMLILSLKRFDLDYNTFETVKLNSRCAFGQTLNMKQYTLDGLEAMEQAENDAQSTDPAPMETETGPSGQGISGDSPLDNLPDDDYEYKLAGVLVHAGVAQGGHYYSFIKDRSASSKENWYRFDDDDVTPFDPASIETECFGGKVKKETKWPNGQVHTVESEQYANALMLFYEKVQPSEVPDEPESDDEEGSDKTAGEHGTNEEKDSSNNKKEKKEKLVPPPKNIPLASGYDVFEPDVRLSNATHRWQSFLFDSEFQAFMKNLLGFCRSTSGTTASSTEEPSSASPMEWRSSIIDMLLSFMFDIFLYSAEKPAVGDWVRMFYDIFAEDPICAQRFILELALKTKTASANWLRTYLSDCPDQGARHAAMRIFTVATQSCLSNGSEQKKLSNWAKAWKDQITELQSTVTPLPCTLGGEWMTFESLKSGDSQSASCIGIVLSFLNILLEASSRNWRHYPELYLLIRNMANTGVQFGGDILRTAMIESLIPARLICLVIRERAPGLLRASFPGCSVATDVAETQIRAEQNPTGHMMTMGNNQGMNTSDMNYRGGGSPMDHLPLFEALACLLGLVGIVSEPLIVEVEENVRGRQRIVLTEQASAALQVVFEESHSPSTVGMDQRDIEAYLQRCGVDSASVPTQKIIDIMAKYPTTQGSSKGGSKGGSYLSLEGFLAYYRDTAQTNEIRVRADLHGFGFRPDLSRRPAETFSYTFQGREQKSSTEESVSLDVASHFGENFPDVGSLAALGLQSFYLYNTAFSANEAVAEYLLAASTLGNDSDNLVVNTLKAVYLSPPGWAGNESVSAATMALKVLASIRDSHQRHRISMIMQCPERPSHHIDSGIGLLVAARVLSGPRTSQQHYSNDAQYGFDRYVAVLKELLGLHSVFLWMNENRNQWHWMERDLLDTHHQHGTLQGHQARDSYAGNRHGGAPISIDHHNHSDSDMPLIHSSEDDDDEESRLDDVESIQGPSSVEVKGAGQPIVNGTYSRSGVFEGACMYSRRGDYRGERCMFSLFKCNVSNNTKHWYISIVPMKGQPGTSADVDFYSAPVKENCTDFPPAMGWTKSNEGQDPPPTLIFRDVPSSTHNIMNIPPSNMVVPNGIHNIVSNQGHVERDADMDRNNDDDGSRSPVRSYI